MLVVVAVEAQQFPVAAVRRVVVMVVILVMDRQLPQLFTGKLTPAAGADPGKKLERSLPIALFPQLSDAPGLGHVPFQFASVQWCLLRRHRFTFKACRSIQVLDYEKPTASRFYKP